MKLGVKIVITSDGVSHGQAFNHAEVLTRHACDVRPMLRDTFYARSECISCGLDENRAFDESSRIIYRLQLLGSQGYIITVIQASPAQMGRPFDNTAAWVYFPKEIGISGEQTVDVLDSVSEIISDPYSIDESRIAEIAAKEYGECAYLRPDEMPKADKGKTGIVEYGADSGLNRKDLLGKDLCQPEYYKYKNICLVDKSFNLVYHHPEHLITKSAIIPLEPQKKGSEAPDTTAEASSKAAPKPSLWKRFLSRNKG